MEGVTSHQSSWGRCQGWPPPPAAEPSSLPLERLLLSQEPASSLASSSPSDSNSHRCQWSPQSPVLPALWGNVEAASEIPRDPDRSLEAQRVMSPPFGTK